jgi:hypothetical protein
MFGEHPLKDPYSKPYFESGSPLFSCTALITVSPSIPNGRGFGCGSGYPDGDGKSYTRYALVWFMNGPKYHESDEHQYEQHCALDVLTQFSISKFGGRHSAWDILTFD